MVATANQLIVVLTWYIFPSCVVFLKEGNTMYVGGSISGMSTFIGTAVREAERIIPKEYVSGPDIPPEVTEHLKKLFGILNGEEPSTPSPTEVTTSEPRDQGTGSIIDSQALERAEITTQEPQIEETTASEVNTDDGLTTEEPRNLNGGHMQTSETLSLSSQKHSIWNDTHVVTNWTTHSTLRSETSQNDKLINILESINRENGSVRIQSSQITGNPEVISQQVHVQTNTVNNKSMSGTPKQQWQTNHNPLTTDYRYYLGHLPHGLSSSWFYSVYLPWITGGRYVAPTVQSPSLYQRPHQTHYTGTMPSTVDTLPPFYRGLLTRYLFERLLDIDILP